MVIYRDKFVADDSDCGSCMGEGKFVASTQQHQAYEVIME